MKKICFLVILMLFAFSGNTQSYEINYFQSSYDTLVDYNSVNLELLNEGQDPYLWNRSFDFGFEFPFGEESFSQVIMSSAGAGRFPQFLWYNLHLFSGSYVIAEIIDTSYLSSEVRYDTLVSSDSLKCLVMEYHNVYVRYEYEENGTNHFINFQIWFYENGIMELHIGDIDLTNCSYYFPGQGLSFDNQDPTGEIYGPWVKIKDMYDNDLTCFFGNHEDPMVLDDDNLHCGVLTSIPPSGFVVQFAPSDISSTTEVLDEAQANFTVAYQDDLVKIMGDSNCFKSCYVYDYMGHRIDVTEEMEFSINSSIPQMIILHIDGACGPEVHKLIVR